MPNDLISREAAKAAIEMRLPGFYLDAALDALDALPAADAGEKAIVATRIDVPPHLKLSKEQVDGLKRYLSGLTEPGSAGGCDE